VAASGNAGFGAAVASRRAAFRRWRRACPFWGGIASNFGGFFIGMLLGIIGGSMGFGWTPSADQPARRPLDPPRNGGRVMAAAVLPLLLASTTLAGQNAAHDAIPRQQQDCILGILCLPSPAPSQAPSRAPAATQPASPSPGRTPQPSTSAGSTSGSQSKTAAGTPGVEASTATSVIVAGSAALDGMSYQGTTQVPTARTARPP
jgi:hypothetical protein